VGRRGVRHAQRVWGRQVLRFLLDENGTTVSSCTSAVEHAGKLYLGNVHDTSAAVLTL
jgi:hypothetical protein